MGGKKKSSATILEQSDQTVIKLTWENHFIQEKQVYQLNYLAGVDEMYVYHFKIITVLLLI